MRMTLVLTVIALTPLAFMTAFTTTSRAGECGEDAFSVAEHIFHMSDTNDDDALSPEEFSAAGLEKYSVSFDEFDVNGDGAASLDEYLDLFVRSHPPKQVI